MTSPCSKPPDEHLLGTSNVSIPIKWKKRGGRKLIVIPDGAIAPTLVAPRDETMVKAIARGFRWRFLIDNRTYATIDDIAAAEKINPSYISRIIRLSLLAPSIVTGILDGTQPPLLQLRHLLMPFPTHWAEQRRHFGFDTAADL